jgi:predicted RNA-binding Zn ribbon-like protein
MLLSVAIYHHLKETGVTSQLDFAHYNSRSVVLAIDLVNTLQPVTGRDTLLNENDLKQFFVAHEEAYILTPEETVTHPDYQVGADLYRAAIQTWDVRADDVAKVCALRSALRRVFEQAASDEQGTASLLNEQMRLNGVTPRISWHHGPLHLHFESIEEGCAHWLAATTVMGLVIVLCDFGADRLGICASSSCRLAFVDTSKNARKRYCSETCAHRESVAAFRARRRARP